MYNKIRLSPCVKTPVEPYIIRNGGLVTPQLDNILEKARLNQLRGQLLELRWKSKKAQDPKMIYRIYIAVGYTMFCRENSARMEAAVNLVLKKEDLGIPGMPVPGKRRGSNDRCFQCPKLLNEIWFISKINQE